MLDKASKHTYDRCMRTKQDAIQLFDGVPNLANALSITPQAIYQWPEELTQERIDRITGAAIRTGRLKTRKRRNSEAA